MQLLQNEVVTFENVRFPFLEERIAAFDRMKSLCRRYPMELIFDTGTLANNERSFPQ
jgi:hypothetical protein